LRNWFQAFAFHKRGNSYPLRHGLRAVPLVGINAAEGKTVRRGAPPALRLRFPVGARIETQNMNDEWMRGTVVSHWVKVSEEEGRKKDWGA
jgi:hypothetical protein